MGKISLVSAKYIVHASIEIKGAVDKPDIIGAIFGQTEGLLGSDLELRELQRSGRIGRIEVNAATSAGVTRGNIIIPSSLDKAETSIVAASMEIIQRIGPCDAKIKVEKIEDVRISKRSFVLAKAKELLKHLTEEVLPQSQELADEVASAVRVLEIQEYGPDRLPAGPAVNESEEIVIVEGRADVLNLLKHGINNAIAINGTSVPNTIKDFSRKKVVTAFVDGDRGGDLIIKELVSTCEVDFYTKAPDGKEVEELSKKEIFQALRNKKPAGKETEEAQKEIKKILMKKMEKGPEQIRSAPITPAMPLQKLAATSPRPVLQKKVVTQALPPKKKVGVTDEDKNVYREILEDLIGTRAACVLDENLEILGKVPVAELRSTIRNMENVFAVVFDGDIDQDLLDTAEKTKVSCLVGMEKKIKTVPKITVLTVDEL